MQDSSKFIIFMVTDISVLAHQGLFGQNNPCHNIKVADCSLSQIHAIISMMQDILVPKIRAAQIIKLVMAPVIIIMKLVFTPWYQLNTAQALACS